MARFFHRKSTFAMHHSHRSQALFLISITFKKVKITLLHRGRHFSFPICFILFFQLTTIYPVFVSVLLPYALVAVSVTVYVPFLV
jgi:hypothetical protein